MTQEFLAHPWFGTWLAALIAVPLALLAHRVGGMVLRRITRPAPAVHAMVVNCTAPARLVLPLAALMMVWQAAPEDLRYLGSVRHFTGLLLIAASTWFVLKAISGFADGVLAQHPSDISDNLQARRVLTQTRVLARTAMSIVVVAGGAMMLMTFPGARQVGASLLASAGVIGIVAGLAAKPVFSNLIAGLQIALSQPIRIDDVLVVEGEWGRVEEITATYVVLRIWDQRRLIIPLQWLIEHPFQNWTRTDAGIIGTVLLWVDLGTPLEALRAEAQRLCEISEHWDGRLCKLQVVEASERAMQLRVLVTSASSGQNWDLRCEVREGLLAFVQAQQPAAVPRLRTEWKEAPVPRRRRIDAERAALSEA